MIWLFKMKVFPNPLTRENSLSIDVVQPVQGTLQIEVYTLAGKRLFTWQKSGESGTHHFVLTELDLLAPGTYLLKGSLEGYSSWQKLLILE